MGSVQIGHGIIHTEIEPKTRRVVVQLGDPRGAVDTAGASYVQHTGFASIPPKCNPDTETAAYAVVVKGPDRDTVIGSIDERGLELYANLGPGETCLYAAGDDGQGQARILLKKNGSINLYTKLGNTADGKGMAIMVDPTTDTITLLNSKGHGIVIDADGVKITDGRSSVVLEDGDVTVLAEGTAQMDGGSVVLGSAAVLGVNNALTGMTGVAGVPSTKVLIATA